MTSDLQQKMFLELIGHEIFETAKLCADATHRLAQVRSTLQLRA
jgi:hypothetical protein